MSAISGIGVSEDLVSTFSSALGDKSIRFVKVSIQNESLVHDTSVHASGTLEQDFDKLSTILHESTPAYVLARTDEPSEWLAIYYVPETAKIRDKMLYASTRASLTKSLGAAHFPTSLYAHSLSDLTPAAYAAHLAHLAAPKPLSQREKEMAAIKDAEREAGNQGYRGSSARVNHVGSVGLAWEPQVEDAIKELAEGDGNRLIVMKIDPVSEKLTLVSASDTTVEQLASSLPASEPTYSFFAWANSPTSPPQRTIIFIYSCPSATPIKEKMVYASGCYVFFGQAKLFFTSSSSVVAKRKIETSDPKEIDEAYLIDRLGLNEAEPEVSEGSGGGVKQRIGEWEKREAFAKPKGPARRR